jgi:hypothetical protein
LTDAHVCDPVLQLGTFRNSFVIIVIDENLNLQWSSEMSEFTICGYMTEQPLIFPHPAPMPMYNIETTILGFAVQTSAAITRLEFVFSKKLDPLHRQKIFVVYNLLCLHVLYSESTCMVLFSLVGTPKITRGSATHL